MTSLLPSDDMRKLLEERTQEYQSQFEASQEALTYWVEQRGMSKDLASLLRIGYVETPLPGDQRFQGSLAIPYVQPAGVTWMKFRRLTGDGQKYDAVAGLATRIYNTPILTSARSLVITEGEIDCATFLEIGVAAVGCPGARQWKKEYNRIFRNRNVTVFCDGDEAGRELGSKLTNELMGARIVEAPPGEDANSCYLKYGAEWLREQVKM